MKRQVGERRGDGKGDGMEVLTDSCVVGIEADAERWRGASEKGSLVFATAIVPKIGCEKAALIAKTAHARCLTIPQAEAEIGGITEEDLNDEFRLEIVLGHNAEKPVT